MPAMLLGEMLLKAGALTEEQLEQVLNAQSIYGGRLGTNLVEMGLIGEAQLARLLNEKLGVPSVSPTALEKIPAEVIAAVPKDLAQRYHVLPVALEGKRLTLAMIDPSDFKAIDEIGFLTGLVIVPRVCSELRLDVALEHYHQIKRRLRYIPVEGGFRSKLTGGTGSQGPRTASAAVHPAIEPVHNITMEVLAERLASAVGEGQAVSALMWYLAGEFDRAAFFQLKDGSAVGIQAMAAGAELEGFGGGAFFLAQAPQLTWAVQEKHIFLGEFAAGGAPGRLLQSMGGLPPAPVAVVPVAVAGQVAALICVNDEKGRLSGGLFELQRVAAMAELAFEMLRIRKRIISS